MTLHEKIYIDLKAKIDNDEFDKSQPLPTELELQKEYGVSRITVKQAYTRLTDEGIVKRVRGKGTFINKNAKSSYAPLIGLILCDFDSTFGERLIKQIERNAADEGYGLVLKRSLDNQENEEQAIRELMSYKVSGIIIQNCHGDFTKNLMELTIHHFPVVSVDRYAKGLFIPAITSDNRGSSFKATDLLIKNGHRKILFASANPQYTSTLTEREEGFKRAHIQDSLPLSPDNFIDNLKSPITHEQSDIEKDIDLIKDTLSKTGATGIIATERFVAELCSIAAQRLGKSFPDDIELICFDCSERILAPKEFTYIRQDEEAMAKVTVKALITLINDEGVEMRYSIPAKFIKGNSTR